MIVARLTDAVKSVGRLGPLRRIAGTFSAQIFNQIVTIFAQLFLAPVLLGAWGMQKYGVWLLLSAVPAYLTISDFGFTSVAKNEMTMKAANGDREGVLKTYHSVFAMLVVIAASVGMAFVFGVRAVRIDDAFAIAPVSAEAARTTLLLLGASSLLYQFTLLVSAGFRCSGRPAEEGLWAASGRLGEALAIAAGAWLSPEIWVAASLVLVNRAAFLAVSYYRMTRPGAWLHFGVSRATVAEMRRLFLPSVSYMISIVAGVMLLQGPVMILGVTATPEAIAVFSTLRTLTRLGVSAANLFSYSLMPEYSRLFGAGRFDAFVRTIKLHLLAIAGCVCLYCVGMALAGEMVMRFWVGGRMSVQYPLFWLLIAAVAAEMFWSGAFAPIMSINRHSQISYAFATIGVVAIAFALPVSHYFGADGVAACVLVAHLGMIGVTGSGLVRLAWEAQPESAQAWIWPRKIRAAWSLASGVLARQEVGAGAAGFARRALRASVASLRGANSKASQWSCSVGTVRRFYDARPAIMRHMHLDETTSAPRLGGSTGRSSVDDCVLPHSLLIRWCRRTYFLASKFGRVWEHVRALRASDGATAGMFPRQIIYPMNFVSAWLRRDAGAESRLLEKMRGLLGGSWSLVALGRARAGIYLLAKSAVSASRTRVILSPYTIPDVINMVKLAGATPVFVDCLPNSTNIDFDSLAALVDETTAAVMITHYHVNQPRAADIAALCRARGAKLFEDGAISIGSSVNGAPVGTLGDGAVFSFSGYKIMNFFWGGLVALPTREAGLALGAEISGWPRLTIRDYRKQAFKVIRYAAATSGTLFPLVFRLRRPLIARGGIVDVLPVTRVETHSLDSTITSRPSLAALYEWDRKFDTIETIIAHRRSIAQIYDTAFLAISVSAETDESVRRESGFVNYPIVVGAARRNDVYKEVVRRGFDVGLSLYPNVQETDTFTQIEGRTDNVSTLVRSIITLPTHPRITADYARALTACVAEVLAGR